MNWEKIKGITKYHLVDSTAVAVSTNPIFSALESTVGRSLAGMDDNLSITARLLATATVYGGIGTLFARGRDFSKKMFKITDKTKEKIHTIHDTLYPVAFNLVISPPMYAISQYLAEGRVTPETVATGVGIAMSLSPFIGFPAGYAIDTFRDMSGLNSCERKSYPDLVRKQRGDVKKGLAALLTAASVGVMVGIYFLTPNNQSYENQQPVPIVQTIENEGF